MRLDVPLLRRSLMLVLVAILGVGCVTSKQDLSESNPSTMKFAKEGGSSSSGGSRSRLFPDGKYRQQVSVNVHRVSSEQRFEFGCVVKVDLHEFVVVAFNEFGTTIFKAREDFTSGQRSFESPIESVQEQRSFFMEIFDLAKFLLLHEQTQEVTHKISHQGHSFDARVTILNRDASGVPTEVEIRVPNLYDVFIRTLAYSS